MVDLATTELSAEELSRRLEIAEETARRILEFREGHEVRTAEDLRAAGLEANRAAEVLALANTPVDLNSASAEELRRLGLSDAEIETLRNARVATNYTRYDDLLRSGVSEEVRDRLRNHRGINLERLNTLGAEELANRSGIELEDARRIVEAREGRNVSTPEALGELLGGDRGSSIHSRAAGLNLMEASEADLRAAGLTEEEARRIVRHRSDVRIGYGTSTFGNFSVDRAVNELREAGLVTEAEAERIARNAGNAALETADAETLRERFRLSAEAAERVVNLRDAHTINDAESLRAAGVSEAEAERILSESRAVDPRTATRAEITARTGLNNGAVDRLLAIHGTDLVNVNAEALAERAGVSLEDARRMIEAREAGRALNNADVLVELGMERPAAERLVESNTRLNLMSATVEELTRRGMPEAEARRLVAFRERATGVEGLDFKEIERQLRYKVKLWARNTNLAEALRNSLLPRNNSLNPVADTPENRSNGTFTESTNAAREGEGFSRTRPGAAGEVLESRIPMEEVRGIFESVKEASIARTLARMTDPNLNASERAILDRGIRDVRGLALEVVKTNDILAEYARDGRVRVSTGLLNEIDARAATMPAEGRGFLRARILGLIMAHEASHSTGVRAERVADAEAIRILEASGLSRVGGENLGISKAEIRAAVEAFDRPLGSSHVDNFLNRLRNFFRYGTTAGRTEAMDRAARGETDRFARYRRADGTLRWGEMTRNGVLREAGGTAHFALALFLKEVAVVAATGDRARIEEFFDSLMTTDFYKHYGLFVVGARVGDVAYTRYLQKWVKPKFINGLLKTNLTLAAGIALPMIVEGTFEGKAFAITLGSLGLSTAAVRTGVRSIKWVTELGKAKRAGTLARFGMRAGRLSNVVGWFYTAAELAVILYVAEEIEHRVHGALDLAAARDELGEAGEEWLRAANDPNATPESLTDATSAYHDAWIGYRNYLYRPLEAEEAIYADRLARLAREAKKKATERETALERIRGRAALRASIERRYGSLEAYAEHLVNEDEGEIERDLDTYTESYNMNREKRLEEVYEENRRGTGFLDGVENLDWLLRGAVAGADGDPSAGRNDVFANFSRDRAISSFHDAIGEASRNRPETYLDEAALYEAMAGSLRDRGRDDLADVLDEVRDAVTRTRIMDIGLFSGNGTVDTRVVPAGTGDSGISSRVSETADGNGGE
jgi:DNA uptake protein ComE-like DNA-binding protein